MAVQLTAESAANFCQVCARALDDDERKIGTIEPNKLAYI